MAKETRGRKPKWDSATKVISLRLPADLIDWLNKEANAAGKNRNEFLVELVLKAKGEDS